MPSAAPSDRRRLLSAELRALVHLALPIAITQLGTMTLGIVDTIMVGQLGVAALAGTALGNVWVMGTLIFGLGIILGLDPIVAQAHGAGDLQRQGLALHRGLIVAFLLSLPIAGLWWVTPGILEALGQDPELAAIAGDYVRIQIPSIPAFLGFYAIRQVLQGRGIVGPTMWVILAANLFNIAANQLLIFGGLGIPALGIVGAGLATSCTRFVLVAGLVVTIRALGLHRGLWIPFSRAAFALTGLGELFAFGIPIGVQLGLEMWAFQATLLFAGWLDEASLAAHTIAINIASLSFMIPLGVSMAAVTRIGNLLGACRFIAAQRAAWVALGLGAAVMAFSAILLIALRHLLPPLFTADPEVLLLAAGILPIAACFQLFDGVQVVGSGILRGMGRTRPAAAFNLIGYYVLGLPLALWLAFRGGLGVDGLWWGLTLALAVISILLLMWIRARGPASLAPRA